jgi:hypothetical protein
MLLFGPRAVLSCRRFGSLLYFPSDRAFFLLGIKIHIRKDIRVRKRPIASLGQPSDGTLPNSAEAYKLEQDQTDSEDDQQTHMPLSSQSTSNSAGSTVVKRARHGTLTGPLHLVSGPASAGSTDSMVHTLLSGGNNQASTSIALAGLPARPTSTLDPMLGMASATPGGIELAATNALPHAHQSMAGSVTVATSGQMLSAGGSEPSSSSSPTASAAAAVRKTGDPQSLSSSSTSSYPSSSSNARGLYDRLNYDMIMIRRVFGVPRLRTIPNVILGVATEQGMKAPVVGVRVRVLGMVPAVQGVVTRTDLEGLVSSMRISTTHVACMTTGDTSLLRHLLEHHTILISIPRLMQTRMGIHPVHRSTRRTRVHKRTTMGSNSNSSNSNTLGTPIHSKPRRATRMRRRVRTRTLTPRRLIIHSKHNTLLTLVLNTHHRRMQGRTRDTMSVRARTRSIPIIPTPTDLR